MTFMDARNGERYLERIDARVRQPTVDPHLPRHPMAPGPSAPTTGGGGAGVQAGGYTAADDRPPGRGATLSADPSTEAASPGEAAYTPMSRIRQRTDDAGKRVRRNDPDLQEVPLHSPVPHVSNSPLAPAMGSTSPIRPQQMFPSPIPHSFVGDPVEYAIDTPLLPGDTVTCGGASSSASGMQPPDPPERDAERSRSPKKTVKQRMAAIDHRETGMF